MNNPSKEKCFREANMLRDRLSTDLFQVLEMYKEDPVKHVEMSTVIILGVMFTLKDLVENIHKDHGKEETIETICRFLHGQELGSD